MRLECAVVSEKCSGALVGGRWWLVVRSGGHVARGRASSTVTVHVSFLEKLSNVAHRRRRRGGGREQFASGAHVCGAVATRSAHAFVCVVKWRSNISPLLLGLLVFTSRRCDNELSSSRSLRSGGTSAERDGRRCAHASEPPPAPARPALISLPAAGKRFACATPCRLGLRAASALRRTRIFLDNSTNNLFARWWSRALLRISVSAHAGSRALREAVDGGGCRLRPPPAETSR